MSRMRDLLAAPLDELLAEARRLRPGPLVTYSPKVFIPLTTLCRDVCGYCTFARPPRRGERAYLTAGRGARDRAGRRRARAARRRCSRSATSPSCATRSPATSSRALGCDTTLEYLARMAPARARRDRPAAAPQPRRDDTRGARRAAAGRGVDGDHARDRRRAALATRRPALRPRPTRSRRVRLETIRLAGELAIPFTSGILIGIGETRAERLEALLALRATARRATATSRR